MKRFSIKQNFLTQIVLFGLPGILTAGLTSGVELYTSETEEPEPRKPELSFVYGEYGFEGNADEGLIQQDLGIRDGHGGGIDSLYWENDPSKEWRVYLDGHYFSNPDELFVTYEMHNGYNAFFDLSFSTWSEFDYPGEIYYPPTGSFPVLSAKAFEEEISRLELSLTLMPSDVVKLKMRYSYFERDGDSVSTVYGDEYQFQVGGKPSRGIVPSLIQGTEKVHTADVSLTREEGLDRSGLRLYYQKRRVARQQVVERATNDPAANRYTTQDVNSDDDLFSFSAFKRSELSDTLTGSLGVAFTRLDGDLTGSRVFGDSPEAEYDIDFAAIQYQDRGFLDLQNSRRLSQWIVNGNLVYAPSGNFRWMTGVRLEELKTNTFSSYIDTFSTFNYGNLEFQNQEADMIASSEKKAYDISAFVEGRYTGIKHAMVYSRLHAGTQKGDLSEDWERDQTVPTTEPTVGLLNRDSDFDRVRTFWELGINLFPTNRVKISLEGYLKYQDNGYNDNVLDQPAEDFSLYPGYIQSQKVKTKDINGRVSWRILSNLKSVTRADLQQTNIDTYNGITPRIKSSTRNRVVFNQSLVWTPHPRFYVSGTVNVVEDLTETDAVELESGFEGIIVNLPNDYWQTDLNLFVVLTKSIDLQLSYQYMEMNQYIDTSPQTVPYGMDMEQHHGMAQLYFKLGPRTRANLTYNYYERTEPSAAGLKDYEVQTMSGGLQFIF